MSVNSCGECNSPRLCETEGYLTCLSCGLVQNGALVIDYDDYNFKTHSEVHDSSINSRCCCKRVDNNDTTLFKKRSFDQTFTLFDNDDGHKTAMDKTFEDISVDLSLKNSTLVLAKEIFKTYMDSSDSDTKPSSHRGDFRRPMFAAACVLYAMRDSPEGTMRKDEICVKLLLDEAPFGRIADDIKTTLLAMGGKCNGVIRACLTREININDMVSRMLSGIAVKCDLDTEKKNNLRSATNKINHHMLSKDQSSKMFKNVKPSAQIGAIMYFAARMIGLKEVGHKDVACIANVSTTALDISSKIVNKIMADALSKT